MKQISKIESKPIHSLVPYEANARIHSEDQVRQIADSIARFGFNNPILIDSQGVIIAGHGRLEAAKLLGMETVPVAVIGHLTDVERRAYIIADNKIALNSGWDIQSLANELIQIDTGELDLTITGFSNEELADILASIKEPEEYGAEDSVPAPARIPKVSLGELYLLGENRLLCGDSTIIDSVARLMNNEKADCVFTDPPYNVDYEGSDGQKIQNDKMDEEEFKNFCNLFYTTLFLSMKPGAGIYVFHADTMGDHFRSEFKKAGFHLASTLIWNKSSLIMGRSDYHWKHEPCLYGWKPGASHNWYSDRTQTTVYDHAKGSGQDNKMHPTCKPVSLVEYFLGNSSKKRDLILDLFGGSGSTLIAAQKNDRRCNMMELDPIYCGVILDRWQEFT